MILSHDWVVCDTLKKLRKLHPQFKFLDQPGWYETATDTLLLTKGSPLNDVQEDGGLVVTDGEPRFWLQVWNSPEARKGLAATLGMPVFRPQ